MVQRRGWSESRPMALEILTDPFPQTGAWNLTRPLRQGMTSQGGQPHALGETLAIHFPTQHTQPDQPVEVGLRPFRTEGGEHQAVPLSQSAEFPAADRMVVDAIKEAPPEGKALKRSDSPPQGLTIRGGSTLD